MNERNSEGFESPKSVAEITEMRVKLSILWVFAVLNYIYADVFTLMDSSSSTGSIPMSHKVMLGAAILMETAIVMVPLARFLQYQAGGLTFWQGSSILELCSRHFLLPESRQPPILYSLLASRG